MSSPSPTVDSPWLGHYEKGVPSIVNVNRYRTITEMLDANLERYRLCTAYRFMGRSYSYAQINELATQFGAFLQSKGLNKGDRVGIMMPNIPQYPIVAAAILRAGMVVVNINPLYTARELEHQLKDSGTKLIVILENFAHVFERVQASTDCSDAVLVSVGDLLGPVQGALVNVLLRRIRRVVPPFHLPQTTRFLAALKIGRQHDLRRPKISPEDVAVLQYTGGTTGVSKGATLLHRNLVANLMQCQAWFQSALKLEEEGEDDQIGLVCALPLYHIYAFTGVMLLGICVGGRTILIPNPRDAAGSLKALSKEEFHVFPGVNTLFNSLARHPAFLSVNWRRLRLTMSAGMATQKATAELWLQKTGSAICEAFGMSETSPLVTCNPIHTKEFTGTIGLPVPNTEVMLVGEDGVEVPPGQPGELAVRGPQVMAGYWNRPDETAKTIRPDGFLLTGDVAVMDSRGFFKIVDRKKDMILVSGFNVYPNEIEDVIALMPGVLECAAIGVQDPKSGEALKVFVVRANESVTEEAVRAYCEDNLTGYKRPKYIEFAQDLPKSNVGKILRRELKDLEAKRAQA